MIERVEFLDTTLRDGNKLAFIYLASDDRLEMARQLALLGVDIIDAGYPSASRDEWESVARIAREIDGPCISVLSKAVVKDIEECLDILSDCANPLLHIFLPISPYFLKHQLKKEPEETLVLIERSIQIVREAGIRVQFSLAELGQAEENFLVQAAHTACRAGADIVSLADTHGTLYPERARDLVALVGQALGKDSPDRTASGRDAFDRTRPRLGVHFHNDLGLATANTLAALEAGARHVEATIGGIGPRGGNTPLEEVVFGLELFKERLHLDHGIRLDQLDRTSSLVSRVTGLKPHPNKAILGKCAFQERRGTRALESLDRRFRDLMQAGTIGRSTDVFFGDQELNYHGFVQQLQDFGIETEGFDLEKLYRLYQGQARRKKTVYLAEVLSMAEDTRSEEEPPYVLSSFSVMTGSGIHPVGTVELTRAGASILQSSTGTGPIDALCQAVDKAVGIKPRLLLYSVDSLTEGKDARAEVTVSLAYMGRRFHGHHGSTDVVEASLRSYLDAVNRIEIYRSTRTEEENYIDGESLWWE